MCLHVSDLSTDTQRMSNFLSHELEILEQQVSSEAQQQNEITSSNVSNNMSKEIQIGNTDADRRSSNSSGVAQASNNTISSFTTSVENKVDSQIGSGVTNDNKDRDDFSSGGDASADSNHEQKANKWRNTPSRMRFSRLSAKNKVAAGGLPELFHLPENSRKVRPPPKQRGSIARLTLRHRRLHTFPHFAGSLKHTISLTRPHTSIRVSFSFTLTTML